MKKAFSLIAILALISSCASRPKVTTNLNKSAEEINKDIDECMLMAETNFKNQGGSNAGKNTAKGAAGGAAIGAAGSILSGNNTRSNRQSAGVGALIGAVGGAASSKGEDKMIIKSMTNQCLHKRGYRIHGWN